MRAVTPSQRANRAVEWLAALWALTDGHAPPRTANPDLLPALHRLDLADQPAYRLVTALRRGTNLDRLVKGVVRSAYGLSLTEPGAPPLPFAGRLVESLAQLDLAWGERFDQAVAQGRVELAAQIDPLLAGADPAQDLAELVGEPVPLRLEITPSLFLAPPQAGRHGLRLAQPDGDQVHLYFGLPLGSPPGAFGITREWLVAGGWHYAVECWLDRYWPQLKEALGAQPNLADTWTAATNPPAGGWLRSVRTHLSISLMAALWARQGYPTDSVRLLARGQRLLAIDWFADWLAASTGRLSDHLASLPAALVSDQAEWERQAQVPTGLPDAINLTMAPLWRGRPRLVCPDRWSDEALGAVQAGWERLRLPALRHSAWLASAESASEPAIAYGDPLENPLVAAVLAARGLGLHQADGAEPVLVALARGERAGDPWRLAIAAERSEQLTPLGLDQVLRLGYTWAILDGGRLQRGQVGTDSPMLEWEALA